MKPIPCQVSPDYGSETVELQGGGTVNFLTVLVLDLKKATLRGCVTCVGLSIKQKFPTELKLSF